MVDKEGIKDHCALRKHREKRRAKAGLPPPDEGDGSNCNEKNSQTASTEVSLGDFVEVSPGLTEKTEMVTTIIATKSDHDRMRKISILGLEDPADSVRSTRRMDPQDANFIVSTKSLQEQMRKISKLGLEDPADLVAEVRQSRRARGKERESRPGSARQTSIRSSHNLAERHDQVKQAATKNERVENSPNVSGEPVALPSSPRPRSRSFDNDDILLESSRVFNRKDKKPFRTRSFDLDQSFMTGDGIDLPSVPVSTQQSDFTESRIVGPKEFGGVIEATKEQQHLMRKISALGMYDPVYGHIHKDLEISHASIVFEDMDFDDVPKDMRDMLGHASEHTDPVVRAPKYITESEKSSAKEMVETNVFVPPVGSFVRRGSKRNDSPVLPPTTPTPAHSQSETRKAPRALPVRHTQSTRVRETKEEPFSDQVSRSYSFIPPTGSFNVRKARERSRTPTRKAILKDIELAARAQSMFADDSLLGPTASNLESALHASLGSIDYDMSSAFLDVPSSKNDVHVHDRKGASAAAVARSLPPGVGGVGTSSIRRKSATSTKIYVPPQLLSQSTNDVGGNNRGTNGPSPPSPSKDMSHSRSNDKATSSSPRKKRLDRQPSSRSWGGDSDLEDPMANMNANSNPMWASLSVLHTDFGNLES